MIGLLNIVLPVAERWFVQTYNEALPLVKDSRLAEDMRGFIGQQATHADVHDQVLNDLMVARGVNAEPILPHTLVDVFRWHGSEEVEHAG